jgi:hypothetical protein
VAVIAEVAVSLTLAVASVASAATYWFASKVADKGALPKLTPPAKNVTEPVGAAPELPPEERTLLLCVSTNADREKRVFAATEVTLGVTTVVVGACKTVNANAVDALLAL